MKHLSPRFLACLLLGLLITGSLCIGAAASEDDNSLYSLGLMTDGAVVEQDVEYGVYEFDVIVPAGTTELELDPIPSNENASIRSIEGTELDVDGNGTVLITVEAPNGDPFTYTVHVTSLDEEPQTQKQTEPQTEAQTEKKEKETEPQTETEEKLYVEVPRDTVTQAQNTITDLQNEIIEYRENVNLYQKIMYVLLAVSIVFLFIIINMLLRNRDLKAELKEYRSLGYVPSGKNKDKGGQGGSGSGPAEQAPEAPAQKERKKDKHSVYYEKAPLDVAPQTSSRSKRLPEYESGQAQPAPAAGQDGQPSPAAQQGADQNAQAAPEPQQGRQPAPAQAAKRPADPAREQQAPAGKTNEAPASRKDNSGVQVDMIDL